MLVCTSILAYVAIVQPWSLRQISLPLSVGDVAPQDLRAPRNIQYASEVLTEAARNEAERAVAPVYIPPDTAIARTQSEMLNSILVSISAIRTNQQATIDQKRTELFAIQGLTLQPGSQDVLLALSDTRWELVQTEAFTLLEQGNAEPRADRGFGFFRQNLPSLVSLTLTEKEAALVVEIVSPLVVANSFYSPELTDAARQTAHEAVEPVIQSFIAGQTVVTRGQVISAADLEALTALGLVMSQNPAYNYLGAAALVALLAIFIALYFFRRKPVAISDLRGLILLALLFAIFLVAARVSNPNRTIVPYLFPVPAFALLVSALFGMERGVVFGLLMSLLAAYGMPDALGLLPYYTLSSLVWRAGVWTGTPCRAIPVCCHCYCSGWSGHGGCLPSAFHRDGLGWAGHSDGRGSFFRDCLNQHCTTDAVFVGSISGPDNCPAIARNFPSRFTLVELLPPACSRDLPA